MKKLLASYLITTLCSWVLEFLIPLYVFDITKSAMWTSMTFFAAMAPYILVTPFAGVWSDRYKRRTFLMSGDALNMLVACLIFGSITALNGNLLALALVSLNFLLASISATHHPMFQSLAPELLDPADLAKFNSVVNAIDNTIRIIAPLVVAALLMITTKLVVLVSCGLGFVLSLPLLFFIPEAPSSDIARCSIWKELADGIKYVRGDDNLVSFSTLFFCVNFGLAIIGSNLIYIFSHILSVSPDLIGYYYGIIGLGAVAGSFVAPKLIGKIEDATLIFMSCFAAGALALFACLTSSPLLLSIIWAGSTACQSLVIVTFFTFRQKVVRREILGRTIGVTRLISYLAIPPASVIGGLIMDKSESATLVFGLGGSAIIIGSLLALRAPAFKAQMRRILPAHR